MTTTPQAPPWTRPPAGLPPERPMTLPVDARWVAFTALALYGARHWAGIVRPAEQGRLFGMLVVALVAGAVLRRMAALADRAARVAARTALGLVIFGLVLALAGAPSTTLRPDHWDQLVSGIAGALASLPALRIPYRGLDEWVSTVLLCGGGLLMAIAAALTFAHRPRVFGAAVALGVLYIVPIVEHGPAHPYLDGALFSLLLAAFLWIDRLRERDAALAGALIAAAVLASAIVAPRMDSSAPWVDYEALAESLQAGKQVSFRWNHDYGPLRWSRDGLELARVRVPGSTDLYLKTAALEEFDGVAWRQTREPIASDEDTELPAGRQRWMRQIHVTVKGLRSKQFLGAGTTLRIVHSTRLVGPSTPGTFVATARPLRRGDSYDAIAYVPRPSPAQMDSAPTGYPSFVSRQLTLGLPARAGTSYGSVRVGFAPWHSGVAPAATTDRGWVFVDPEAEVRLSPYRRTYALAQRLALASHNPYDYVRKVIARVQRGARYTETPPPPGRLTPLDAFLFRDRAGYCQHFAGATALLLRMGGVPARVVSGFSPGSRAGHDQVIRDFDAHSWVEVYFPTIGWVTFDPTPAASPARSQLTDTLRVKANAPGEKPAATPAGDRGSDPTSGGAAAGAGGGGTPWEAIVAGVVALVGLPAAAVALWARRRRRLWASGDPELEELRLALVRSGREPSPDLTLRRIEQGFSGSEGALAYVRALRLARYGAAGDAPTPAQRRALRRELGAGLGMRGRLRALRALPPRPREVIEALRPRRRRPYTA